MRFQLSAAVAAILFVAISGTSLPAPSHDYDGCPPHTMEWCEKNRTQSCSWATQCGVGKKCCPVSCNGLECMPVAKQGSCMMTIQGCASAIPDPINCNNDYQCGGELKCCSTPCSGRTCQAPDYTVVDPNPNKPKPGECKPVNWAAIQCLALKGSSGTTQRYGCSSDSECTGTAKCCDNPCTQKLCKEPAACPYFNPDLACLVQNPTECKVGTKCSSGRQCCAYECGGTRCEPEMCPGVIPNIQCIKENPKNCSSSDSCGKDYICCSYECGGRKCVRRDYEVRAGSCPAYTGEKPVCLAVVPTNECENDGQCDIGMKCCTKKCGGLACMAIVSEKLAPEIREGTCPNNVGSDLYCATVVPTNDCDHDGQCEPGRKCCKKPCGGLGCMAIVKVYPPAGTPVCPIYNKNLDCSNKRGAYTCNPTDKCSNGGKCCDRECSGTSCEVNLCPAPDRSIQCYLPETRQCNTSSTCANGQVCCEIFCGGTRCVSPVGPNSGSDNPSGVKAVQGSPAPICPKPDSNPSCPASLQKRACTNDAQCGGKKCCETGCNVNVCQTPVRPGTCPNMIAKCRAPTEADKKNQCGTDMSCPNSQKCCPSPCTGYGARCMDPVV